ncbi:lysophospholipid acyltransferase family protein [Congregibacter litoralis]|uniref:1-acyl-sn-glycerol-3-phosphate acyltransferase n=1 Tax=Congregibacter litoralis KT71 TaxID=314285 RepID=A4A819_9GAMM|nr:lysophospholipid acyltransferase family protein [Congregibacter litoralis]EAQ97814.1 1-acyl-sn-glycerol-3-phosphate acyltransferase [Congregibacter litoralis KT71]
MNAVRSSLVFAWMVISIIPIGLGLVVFSLFLSSGALWAYFARPWLRGVIGAARWIGGVDYELHGADNLPEPDDMRRVILVSKHQSTWETFFFPSMMPHNLAYVFKRELLRIPIFGWCMARLEMVPIDRSKRSEAWNKVAQFGVNLMDKGRWIIMFPEGTRSARGGQGNYKNGASRLAVATDAWLIPIAVSSGQCWPRRSFSFIPGKIDVSIGTPIQASGGDPEALMRQVETWIEGEMRRIDPEAYSQEHSDTSGSSTDGG